jgi:hypothetical protein
MPAGMPGCGGRGVLLAPPPVIVPTPQPIKVPSLVGWSRSRDYSLYTRTRAGVIPSTKRTFTTGFNLTETPISEGGNWTKRDTARNAVATTGGIACGTQTAHAPPPYDDSYSYINGVWAPDTEAIATVFRGSTGGIQEIEFLFRFNDSAGSGTATGYEINIAQDGSYVFIGAWQGGLNLTDFRQIGSGSSTAIADGYQFKARCEGATLSMWVDRQVGAGWELVITGTDTGGSGGGAQFTSGSPGIGFYTDTNQGTPAANDQYGWRDYTVREL